MPVQPMGNSSDRSFKSNTAIREKMRAEYHSKTKKFEPMVGGDTKKIENLEKMEEKVARVAKSTARSTHTLKQEMKVKGDRKEFNTKGVGFILGNAKLYRDFIMGVSQAQRSL